MINATQGSSRKQTNKCNNQTNNVVEVARKCDNVYGQKSPLQMYIHRLICSITTVHAEYEHCKNKARTEQEQSKNGARTKQE